MTNGERLSSESISENESRFRWPPGVCGPTAQLCRVKWAGCLCIAIALFVIELSAPFMTNRGFFGAQIEQTGRLYISDNEAKSFDLAGLGATLGLSAARAAQIGSPSLAEPSSLGVVQDSFVALGTQIGNPVPPEPPELLTIPGSSAVPAAQAASVGLGAVPGSSLASGIGDTGEAPSTLAGVPISSTLLCPPHVAWNWHYTTGTGIENKYAYLLRMALRANGNGEVVYAIQQTSPGPCILTNSWDWRGTVVVRGPQMIFTTQGFRVQTDTCNKSLNGRWPISGVINIQWSLDPTNTKLSVITPWHLAFRRTQFTLSKVRF